jgi:hypothetical protein
MTYNGRRAPNVAEYIAQLNAIPSAQDLQNADSYNLEDDLAMFTNTHFFDFDLGQDADLQPESFDARGGSTVTTDGLDMKPLDFNLEGKICHYICFLPLPLLLPYLAVYIYFTVCWWFASLLPCCQSCLECRYLYTLHPHGCLMQGMS